MRNVKGFEVCEIKVGGERSANDCESVVGEDEVANVRKTLVEIERE